MLELGLLTDTNKKETLLAYFEQEAELWLNWLASFTRGGEPGVTRLLYTKEWLAAQRALEGKMTELGLVPSFDEIGNLYGKIKGVQETAPSIITGSHIDTVVQGGKYDGAYGIVAGLLAIDYLQRTYGQPVRSLEVVSLCEEEGSRFPMAYWGSGSVVGKRSFAQIDSLQDEEGISFREAMADCGFGEGAGAPARRADMAAYIEVHIEQGAVLEREGLSLGVVEAIAGQRRLKFTIGGESNHAGTTPMHMRRDALEGTSAMIGLLRQEAVRLGPPLVATVGRLQVLPNVVNVVPGKVEFTVDARHADGQQLDAFCRWTVDAFERIAAERGLDFACEEWFREEPVPMNERLKKELDDICRELAIPSKRMVSGAGHDGQMFHHSCPTALLFVPSRGGISHSPDEYTSPKELAIGIMALAKLLYKLGYEGELL
ncbi:M20 family metallo-hydrolase [Paenibacillus sp. NPDC058071]|uniref:M20 family metallo-hydrolase n=1 Tax=Paenibacillus sp. NPDC058071 TaxID=3346326 RepID=UPI0036D76D33